MAELNQRLDAIEERFNEALGQVVKRSDMDGLKLIEAHVMELAAHVEETRGRLDRIDAIDDQMQSLARRLEDGDHQRLDALEKLLQDYVAEWRKGDERTASTLQSLEDVISRLGESIEAMEAHKPAPDLALAARHTAASASPRSKAIRCRRFMPMRPACWSPRPSLAAGCCRLLRHRARLLRWCCRQFRTVAGAWPPRRRTAQDGPAGDPLPSPSFLVSMMRQIAPGPGAGRGKRARRRQPAEPLPDPAPEADAATRPAPRRARPSLLLAGGITLFAAIGYLLVDIFMTTSVRRFARPRPSRARGLRRKGGSGSHCRAACVTADVHLAGSRHQEDAHDRQSRDGPGPSAPRVARIDAIGSAMAAAFRTQEAPTARR